MELITYIDWVGYAAMATLLVSFMMKNLRTLRLVNSVGCLLFVVYGFLLNPHSYPIIITNTAIVCINLYYLFLKKD
ncbi:MAG TPA: uroporphyrinogen decarboxylase [Aquaticitalea sp.]|nr:uroporphyrinogen decarboxylase [Aquaticitalea sp.]HNU60074.1 uroporphyrinogen decarboxylase [Aquaticitalea sp.]